MIFREQKRYVDNITSRKLMLIMVSFDVRLLGTAVNLCINVKSLPSKLWSGDQSTDSDKIKNILLLHFLISWNKLKTEDYSNIGEIQWGKNRLRNRDVYVRVSSPLIKPSKAVFEPGLESHLNGSYFCSVNYHSSSHGFINNPYVCNWTIIPP